MQETLRNFYNSSNILVRLWKTFIYVLVFVSIIELFMEYNFLPHNYDVQTLKWLDVTIAFVFLADYLLRLYIAPKKWQFIKQPYNILDIVAILPSFLVFLDGAQVLRGARLIRALRALRVLRFIRIARLIEEHTKIKPKNHIQAAEEQTYYLNLKIFYENLKDGKKANTLARETKTLFNRLNKELNTSSTQAQVDQRRMFAVSFYELMRQAFPVVQYLQKSPENEHEQTKLRFILREMGDLLIAETGLSKKETVEERETGRLAHLFLLVKASIHDVIIVATIAFCLNLFLRISELDGHLAPALSYISVIEGVLGTLIIMITTFNIKYANKKRDDIDLQTMKFMNFLTYYSTRIRTLLDNFEEDDAKRKEVAKELKFYFDSIGFNLMHSAYASQTSEVRFDTGTMQILERIRFTIKPYKAQLDTRTFDKYEEMHGDASMFVNQLQIEATRGIPTLFNELNRWMIRVTYFTLLALSPLSAIPRLLIMYIIQRAFYRTAREADTAILSHSLAKIPLEQRVVRRLCRIGAIFSY